MIRLFALAALIAPLPAAAQWPRAVEQRLTPDYDRCMSSGDAANGVTSAMSACNGAEIARQDARLNQAYVMVMRRLPAARKVALRNSERAWIARRDAACARAASTGGTIDILNRGGCYLRQTIERTLWLERYR